MIGSHRVIGIVPARGGSKGVPGKNIAPCGGKPLIAWTLEAAAASRYIDQTVVTTDSLEISQVAMRYGCSATVSRPAELATDEAPMDGVVLHALKAFGGYHVGVLLQPTSPLRTAGDIDATLELLEKDRARLPSTRKAMERIHYPEPPPEFPFVSIDSVVSVHESHAVPFDGTDPPRRQDRKPMLVLNGAIYCFRIEWFNRTRKFVSAESVPYVMPQERSVDVDYPLDLALAGLLIGTNT